MQRVVIPPRRWVPVDLWLIADRARRDAELGAPTSIAEIERRDVLRRAAARRGKSS